MPNKDTDLLARLNALKPSSISLNQNSASVDVEVSKPQSVEDKLADRLKRLRGQDEIPSCASNHESAAVLTAQVTDEVAVDKDAIQGWQQQDGEEQSLDDLIAELDALEPEWKLKPDESKDVEALLKEVAASIPVDEDSISKDIADATDSNSLQPLSEDPDESSKTEDQRDSEEADAYVARLLAALELEEKHDKANDPTEQPNSPTNLTLPSTPSTLKDPQSHNPPSYEDSELQSRFQKLGMISSLPSTPQTKPSSSSSKPVIQATLKPPTSGPPFSDAEIETWCCICNSDGEIRCLGCDGDIYCAECWNEGHGSRPGQERGHRAVEFSAKGKGKGKGGRREVVG